MFLALDTSTLTLALALLHRGPPVRVIEQVLHGPPRKQSEMLPGVIAELLERHGVELQALEAIVVGLGPGSFTGLRIGLATAKALAYAARIPVAGASSPASYVLPIITLSLHSAAVKARITRSSMLEVFGQDYLRTARAKGLRERVVVVRHALKNALIPISTIIGIQFGALLGGAFIIENIFGWPGIGRLATQAIFNRDFPVVQGTVLVGAATFALTNLAVDLLYAWLDPRIRYS